MLVQLLFEALGRVLSQVFQDLVVGVCRALRDLLVLLDPLTLSVDPHVLHISE